MAGFEPYGARDVERVLVRLGATLDRNSSTSRHIYRLPDGRELSVPSGSRLPVGAARRVAAGIGMSWPEFRAAVGHPIVNAGRPKRSPNVSQSNGGCTKRQVLDLIAAVRRSLNEVEHAVKPGIRDSAFYLRVHSDLIEANALARHAIREATATGVSA